MKNKIKIKITLIGIGILLILVSGCIEENQNITNYCEKNEDCVWHNCACKSNKNNLGSEEVTCPMAPFPEVKCECYNQECKRVIYCDKQRWVKNNISECYDYCNNHREYICLNKGEIQNQIIEANNQFAFDIYSEFSKEEGNVFFSPYSISTALAMTYEGARGKTAEEMQSVLHFPKDDTTRRTGFAGIIERINKDNRDYELRTANALWAQTDYKFLDNYFNTIEQYYGGKVTNLDFVTETEKSRQTINTWVEEQTNNKIKDLIPQGVLDDMTRLVLTNAIYFKGKWAKQFDKENTRESDFRVTPGKTVKVRMMSLTGEEAKFNYTETDDLQILELPYDGGELSMLIMLPREDKLQTIEESLTLEKLSEWNSNLREQEVNVYLPKFTFETRYFMKETLEKMGMPTAFSRAANFSGMDGTDKLYISSVIHQAFVEVNEEGTEAAAATAVVIAEKGMPTTFRADHPFIFVIREKETGNILFLGRVTDPGKN